MVDYSWGIIHLRLENRTLPQVAVETLFPQGLNGVTERELFETTLRHHDLDPQGFSFEGYKVTRLENGNIAIGPNPTFG